jgi:hypothetical protein
MRRASAFTSVSFVVSASFVTFVSFVRPPEARAQTSDVVGVRALGMGGAFTAVADDATSTWWNPAGLASGAFFSAILEYAHPEDRPGEGLRGVSLGFPALGLGYYRLPLRLISPTPSTAAATVDREDEGGLSVFGATVGQSIGQHLVVGSTVKLLHAGETKGGLDMGAMAAFGRARFGLMVRNVTEPEFDTGFGTFKLRRHARAGAAMTTGTRGAIGNATLAVDADLVKTPTLLGDERRVAAGGEVWMWKRMVGLRGGVSGSTIGARRSALSAGASGALRQGTYVDVQLTAGGSDESRDGWAVALRVTF